MTKQDNARILVVEDDDDVAFAIQKSLFLSGYSATISLDRKYILKMVKTGEIDMIILDLGLPDDDGISIAAEVRAFSKVPILMLTGRTGIRDRIAGLDVGADDYMVKPFDVDELAARMRAVLRRADNDKSAMTRDQTTTILLGDVTLDLDARNLKGPLGTEKITGLESRLLATLYNSAGPVSRTTIYLALFHREWDSFDRSLDVHISNIRRKLRTVTASQIVISNIRGKGYKLVLPIVFDRQ